VKKLILLIALFFGLITFPVPAQALLLEFGTTFSGTSPSGPDPWMTAEFTTVEVGVVGVSINTGGLTLDESINGKGIFFNFNPDKDATNLNFAFQPLDSTGNQASEIQTGEDAFKADGGGGSFDINFRWPGKFADRLLADTTVTYVITGESVVASDFNFESVGIDPGFIAAAHIQSIGLTGEDSGWIAVPDPSAVFLLVSACLMGFAVMRKKPKK